MFLVHYLVLPLLTAFLLILAFPDHSVSWLVWVAFVPLLAAIHKKRPWQALLIGLIAGFTFYKGMTPWLNDFPSISVTSRFLSRFYLSLYYGVFALVMVWLRNRFKVSYLVAAPLWTVLELLRTNCSFLAFPWVLLAHTQFLNLPLLQSARITGAYGLTFLIMAVNGAIFEFLRALIPAKDPFAEQGSLGKSLGILSTTLLITFAVYFLGWFSIENFENEAKNSFSISVIQGNISQEVKWEPQYREYILKRYEDLSREAAISRPQLIVWPEAATPGMVLTNAALYARISNLVRESKTSFLIGSAEYPKFSKKLIRFLKSGNTALLINPEGRVIDQYLKVRLVPFAEYLPYQDIISWPDFITPKHRNNFHLAGPSQNLLTVDKIKIGNLICWEIIFPELTRNLVKKGADVIINISNEAWFGRSHASYQLMALAVFRAVENRINLVRANNTGVSGFIDPFGRITGRIEKDGSALFVTGFLNRTIYLQPPGTFYTLVGDLFAYLCCLYLAIIIPWKWIKGKKAKGFIP
jgi:apolipoprotein N-acyltransferase